MWSVEDFSWYLTINPWDASISHVCQLGQVLVLSQIVVPLDLAGVKKLVEAEPPHDEACSQSNGEPNNVSKIRWPFIIFLFFLLDHQTLNNWDLRDHLTEFCVLKNIKSLGLGKVLVLHTMILVGSWNIIRQLDNRTFVADNRADATDKG